MRSNRLSLGAHEKVIDGAIQQSSKLRQLPDSGEGHFIFPVGYDILHDAHTGGELSLGHPSGLP